MNDELSPSKRDTLVSEYLRKHGIDDIEEAPGEIVDAANKDADRILGKGKNN